MNALVTYVNVKNSLDKFYFNTSSGIYNWDIIHSDGLKDYLGDNGKEIQIMWDDDSPTLYHN